MGFHGKVEQEIETLAEPTIKWALILIAVLLLLIAVFVKNKWYQAAVLAWVVLP